jgi:predicted transcriptional regulator
MSFEENIKKWVHLDSEIKDLNEKQKELRNKKNQLCNSIMNEVEEKNLQQAIINITDGKLKFAQTKQTAPLTLSFIDRCLKEVIPNENQVELIMNYIKEKRESKMISEIKRYYSN